MKEKIDIIWFSDLTIAKMRGIKMPVRMEMLFQWHRNWKSNNNFVHPPVKSISSKVSLLAYKVRTKQNVKRRHRYEWNSPEKNIFLGNDIASRNIFIVHDTTWRPSITIQKHEIPIHGIRVSCDRLELWVSLLQYFEQVDECSIIATAAYKNGNILFYPGSNYI